jgi:hypothetical protein
MRAKDISERITAKKVEESGDKPDLVHFDSSADEIDAWHQRHADLENTHGKTHTYVAKGSEADDDRKVHYVVKKGVKPGQAKQSDVHVHGVSDGDGDELSPYEYHHDDVKGFHSGAVKHYNSKKKG